MSASFETSQRRSPNRKYAVIVILVMLIPLAFAAVMLQPREKIPSGLGQKTLPDGTILVLRSALFDNDATYAVKTKKQFGFPSLFGRKYDEVLSPWPTSRIRFAFSRHDPESGDYLGFEPFSHIEYSDRWGSSIRSWAGSAYSCRWESNRGSGSSTHDGTPELPIAKNRGHRFLTLVGHRPEVAGDLPLRVIGWDRTILATFTAPTPPSFRSSGSHPVAINMRHEVDGLDLQLRGIKVAWNEHSGMAAGRLQRMGSGSVSPKVSIMSRGEDVTNEWFATEWLYSDRQGNLASDRIGQGMTGEQPLPDKLPAWKLESDFFRKHSARFRDDELIVVGSSDVGTGVNEVELLAAAGLSNDKISGGWLVSPTVGSLTVPNSMFGGGTASCGGEFVSGHPAWMPQLHVGGSSGGGWGGATWKRTASRSTTKGKIGSGKFVSLSCKWSNGQARTTVKCESDHHLLFLTTDILESNRIDVILHDQSGRRIPVMPVGHMFRRMPVYECTVFPDTESLDIKAVVHGPIKVKFEFPSPLAQLDVHLPRFEGMMELKDDRWHMMPKPALKIVE